MGAKPVAAGLKIGALWIRCAHKITPPVGSKRSDGVPCLLVNDAAVQVHGTRRAGAERSIAMVSYAVVVLLFATIRSRTAAFTSSAGICLKITFVFVFVVGNQPLLSCLVHSLSPRP